jgi:hypothetical protein
MPHPTETVTAFDVTPLTVRARRREVRAFWKAFRHTPGARLGGAGRAAMIWIGAIAVIIGMLAMATGVHEELAHPEPDSMAQLFGMGAMVLLFAIAGWVIWWTALHEQRYRHNRTELWRLSRFAQRNDLDWTPGESRGRDITPLSEQGSLSVIDGMSTRSGLPVRIGNSILSTQNGSRSHSTRYGGFAAVRLGTRLPNIRIESRRLRRVQVRAVAGDQTLSLEGDFDRHFTVRCPTGYERDALYLLTPDVMASLIDHAQDFDIELVDDWVILTTPRDVVTFKPARWQSLAAALNAVTHRLDQWQRWRDDQVPENRLGEPGVVAGKGRRLRWTWGSGALLIVLLAALYGTLVLLAQH